MPNQAESEVQLGVPHAEVVPLTIPQSEVARLLDERDVGDGGRALVLLVAAGADSEEKSITEQRLHCYAYILRQKGVIPLGYSFKFSPLPFSGDIEGGGLDDDLRGLRELGYICRDRKNEIKIGGSIYFSDGENIWLTEEGKEWVDKKLQEDKSRMISLIQELIQELSGKNRGELFEECFLASQIPRR